MKANELMIGDWVLVRRPLHRCEKVRVKSVIGNGTIEAKTRDGLKAFGELVVKPIPLTKEILEKNGFKQIGEKFIWGEIDDDLIEITPSINNSYRIKISVADLMIGCSIWCSYVHELQHALKLCAITKEIIL